MATVYIAPTAQGSADGTSPANAYAYGGLASAESDAGSGGTIYFLDGTYNVSANIIWDADGVTYKSLNRHGAEIIFSTTTHYLQIGSASITAPTIADGFYVENGAMRLHSPSQSTDPNKTSKYINCRFVQTAQQTLAYAISHASADAVALGEITNCEIIAKCATSIRPFNGCNGVTATNCSIFLDMSATTSFSPRVSAYFSSLSNSIIVSNQTNSSFITQNYTTTATNCYFHQMGTTNSSGGTNNVFDGGDPLFVDESSDLRLRPASPAIGAA